jgi:NAD(P)-dependent dehydrogenase (short-subunit alcohol dehydrogenase family)
MRAMDAPPSKRRILVVGASGAFGTRLVELLARDERWTLALAGRRREPLEALATRLRPAARAELEIAPMDRDAPGELATLAPWAVVDAAGPFQGTDYALPRAALAAGAHYVDISDAREAVAGFAAALDQVARAAGRRAVTGASSTPALSCAAADRVTQGWRRIDALRVLIAPGARAPRGKAVIASILSWVGAPIRVFRDGGWREAAGWSDPRRFDHPDLGARWGALAQTPDLDALPARFGPTRDALMYAGLEQTLPHLGLWALGALRRTGFVRGLAPLAGPLRAAAGLLAPLGSDRGGMIVEAEGIGEDGTALRARWSLSAAAGAGPSTPLAPVAALLRRWAEKEDAGCEIPPGAAICVGALALDDILRELAHLPIATRIDVAAPQAQSLFARAMGPDFAQLAPTLRAVHGALDGGARRLEGRASARVGRAPLARVLRMALRLPGDGLRQAHVEIEPAPKGERWTRRIGGSRFVSTLVDSQNLGRFEERIGPLRFVFAPERVGSDLVWRLERWRLGSVPLPRALAPQVRAGARERDGTYHFDVLVAHRWTGLLFAYRGRLSPPPG